MAKLTREELLARYTSGERDFSGIDFTGVDLSNIRDEEMLSQVDYPPKATCRDNHPLNRCIFSRANFSFANFTNTCIRFCNFRDTICFRANFCKSSFRADL